MNIIIQTPGFKATKKLLNFVRKKVEKLEQLNDRIIEANVCLKLDKSQNGENKICEIKLSVPGNDIFASKQASTFEEATTDAIQGIRRQAAEWKEKMNNRAKAA